MHDWFADAGLVHELEPVSLIGGHTSPGLQSPWVVQGCPSSCMPVRTREQPAFSSSARVVAVDATPQLRPERCERHEAAASPSNVWRPALTLSACSCCEAQSSGDA